MAMLENRCANCGRKFGAVSHHHWGLRFCRKACKDSFIARTAKRTCAHEKVVRPPCSRDDVARRRVTRSPRSARPSSTGGIDTVLVKGFADSWAISVSFDVTKPAHTRASQARTSARAPYRQTDPRKSVLVPELKCRGSNAAAPAWSPVPAAHLRISSSTTILMRRDLRDTVLFFRARKDRLLKSWPELQIAIMQLAREGSPPPSLAYLRRSCHGIKKK